jgi:DNA-binding FadR family transcriptional regulator
MEGRLITEEGRRQLIELNKEAAFRAHGEALMDAITNGRFITKADALALLAARKPLEVEIARLAAQNATVAQVKGMRAAIDAQRRHVGDEELATEADIRFHEAVAEGSQNVYLKHMISLLRRHTGYARVITHISRKSGSALAAEHQSILDAVIARDPQRAEEAAKLHMSKLLSTIETFWNAPEVASQRKRRSA